jgi:hypothetical protein
VAKPFCQRTLLSQSETRRSTSATFRPARMRGQFREVSGAIAALRASIYGRHKSHLSGGAK